jgi:hypothetical protein
MPRVGWARLLLAVEEPCGTEDIVGGGRLPDPYVDLERGTIAAAARVGPRPHAHPAMPARRREALSP